VFAATYSVDCVTESYMRAVHEDRQLCQVMTRAGKAGQGRAGQGRVGQGNKRAGQGRTARGRAGHGKARQDSSKVRQVNSNAPPEVLESDIQKEHEMQGLYLQEGLAGSNAPLHMLTAAV